MNCISVPRFGHVELTCTFEFSKYNEHLKKLALLILPFILGLTIRVFSHELACGILERLERRGGIRFDSLPGLKPKSPLI